MVLSPAGPTCRCGNRGCWETRVCATALALPLGLDPADPSLPAQVLERARCGDRAAVEVLAELARWYGIGLAVLVNAFNPNALVLGGLWRDLFPHLEDQVRAAMAERAMRAPAGDVRLVLPALGADSILVGAAELAFGPLLADPLAEVGRGASSLELSAPP